MTMLKRVGIDTYMLLLLAMVVLGLLLPVEGLAAVGMKKVTFCAVALLFFLHGTQLDPQALRAGLTDWRLQGLTFASTYLMLPLIGLLLATIAGASLGPQLTVGLLFLAVLPSTVNSSIAFTSIAGGNLPAAICGATLSNLLGVLLTPLLVALVLDQGADVVNGAAVLKIGTQILLPFALGQLAGPRIADFVKAHRRTAKVLDRGSILLIVYGAFSAGTVSGLWRAIPPATLTELGFVVLVFVLVGMGLMVAAGRLLGFDAPDRTMLFYCGSGKSLASGLPIASALFPSETLGAVVLPVMTYHMLQLLLCAFLSQRTARNRQVEAASAS